MPGDAKEAKKNAEAAGQDVRAKADQMTKDAKAKADQVDQKLESYRRDAAKELDKAAKNTEQNLNKAVDQFDKTVTEVCIRSPFALAVVRKCANCVCVFVQGASKAKGGISSWFGGK